MLEIHKRLRYYAMNRLRAGEGNKGAGDLAHKTDGAAAVDEGYVLGGEDVGEGVGGGEVGGGGAGEGTAAGAKC